GSKERISMSTFDVQRLDSKAADFWQQLDKLTAWSDERDDEVSARVNEIIKAIRTEGDEALITYTNRFDQRQVAAAKELVIENDQLQQALSRVSAEQRQALKDAADRVRSYHQKQLRPSWQYQDEHDNLLGQQVTA